MLITDQWMTNGQPIAKYCKTSATLKSLCSLIKKESGSIGHSSIIMASFKFVLLLILLIASPLTGQESFDDYLSRKVEDEEFSDPDLPGGETATTDISIPSAKDAVSRDKENRNDDGEQITWTAGTISLTVFGSRNDPECGKSPPRYSANFANHFRRLITTFD